MADTLTLTLTYDERLALAALDVAIDSSTVEQETAWSALLLRVNGLGDPNCCDTCGDEYSIGQTCRADSGGPAEYETWCANPKCPECQATPRDVTRFYDRLERAYRGV